jgi:hypothetical protein
MRSLQQRPPIGGDQASGKRVAGTACRSGDKSMERQQNSNHEINHRARRGPPPCDAEARTAE